MIAQNTLDWEPVSDDADRLDRIEVYCRRASMLIQEAERTKNPEWSEELYRMAESFTGAIDMVSREGPISIEALKAAIVEDDPIL